MSIDSMYLNGEKYIKDRALTWTKYTYDESSGSGTLEHPASLINPFDGTVTDLSVYWKANGPGTFAVSDPLKVTVGSQTYTIRLFAYYADWGVNLAAMTEELFESAYQNKYKPK